MQLVGERRRRDGFSEDGEPLAFFRRPRGALRGDGVEKVAPAPDAPVANDDLRPVGIVEVEDARLHEDVGRAEARRVVGIPFDLCRPAHVAFGEHTFRHAAERHGCGIEERLSRDKVLRLLLGIRNDFLGGQFRAR